VYACFDVSDDVLGGGDVNNGSQRNSRDSAAWKDKTKTNNKYFEALRHNE
jgi:hypothetical protein